MSKTATTRIPTVEENAEELRLLSKKLAEVPTMVERRNELIRSQRDAGVILRVIGDDTGLSTTTISDIHKGRTRNRWVRESIDSAGTDRA